MEFTKLETAALAAFVAEYQADCPGLAAQLEAAYPVARDNTGGGFFTDLAISADGVAIEPIASPLDGIGVRLEGMKGNLELLLFFRDGFAYLLEGYSMQGEDTSGIDLVNGRHGDTVLLWPSRKKPA